jgi:citrate synthase
MTADEAVAALGVKKATLYTYASRGLVRTRRDGRRRRYATEDIDDLARRAAAAAGHGAAAGSALDWGAPVLDSAVSSIDVDGPNYRGVPALWLAERDTPFEAVATLLWTGALPVAPPAPRPRSLGVDPALASLVPEGAPVGRALLMVAAALGSAPDRDTLDDLDLVHRLAAWSALAVGPRRTWAGRAAAAIRAASVAGAVAAVVGAPSGARVIDRALVICAEHELNASAFAARVAASTGADRYAVLCAALAAWSGPSHGAASERLEAELAAGPSGLSSTLDPAGTGHRLYPAGDPRGDVLIADARALSPAGPRFAAVERMLAEARAGGHPPPNLDLGLVALAAALDLPPGAPGLVFAIGRTAGWLAHADEQRRSDRVLRPRARYVGP